MDIRYWLALALLGLCIYSGIVGPREIDTISEVLEASHRADGLVLRLGSDTKVVDLRESGFLVEQSGKRLPVRIPADLQRQWRTWKDQLRRGDFVSMRAVYRAEEGGCLLLQEFHIHKGRRLKMVLSLVALFLLAGLLMAGRTKVSGTYA
jgi:hypothetical protein